MSWWLLLWVPVYMAIGLGLVVVGEMRYPSTRFTRAAFVRILWASAFLWPLLLVALVGIYITKSALALTEQRSGRPRR